ncbi:MAG: hypothetical protein LBD11_06930 [Candidatus Peribacteria bacterium]|nr:hypothetical protein [Candidatus Peribacteria bacterium]
MICKKCNSPNTIKYGQGRNHAQRYLCHACTSTFTPQGIRGTYSPSFITEITELYCHQHQKAKTLIQQFGISSRTLIKWKKQHQQYCRHCVP